MRGAVAKALRRAAYGDQSLRARAHVALRHRNLKDTWELRALDPGRVAMNAAKRERAGRVTRPIDPKALAKVRFAKLPVESNPRGVFESRPKPRHAARIRRGELARIVTERGSVLYRERDRVAEKVGRTGR